ncbi:MAG: TonB-dependent receptor domain-containing protein, partial [Myxococcota bacterium]
MSGSLRKAVALLVFGVCLCAAATGFSQTAADAEGRAIGELHVVVFGPPEGLPLEGVTVEAVGPDPQIAETNDDGAAWIRLRPGTYDLNLSGGTATGERASGVEVLAEHTTEVVVELQVNGEPVVDIETVENPELVREEQAARQKQQDMDAEPGSIVGTVTSAESGKPVDGARVFVRGVQKEAQTDADGQFALEVPPGAFDISVIHPEFSTASREAIDVTSGESTNISLQMEPAAVRMAGMTVTIPKIEGGTLELLEQRKDSSAATDVIGAEQFSKTGDSTAAGALSRVTGLTVVGGKYVYVRGLGERYSSTLLNGASLPSPEPEKRVVPLDLFPTSMLESVTIQKTYTADMPGEFGGGVIRMETRSYPSDFEWSVGLSTGFNTDTTFREAPVYRGGRLDWLGTDDGSRAVPSELAEATEGGQRLVKKGPLSDAGFTEEELRTLGRSLNQEYSVEDQFVIPDLSIDASIGDAWELGDGVEAGFRIAGSYSRGNDRDVGVIRSIRAADDEDGVEPLNRYDDVEKYTIDVVTGLIATSGLRIGENHEIEHASLLNRITDDVGLDYSGFNSDLGSRSQIEQLEWLERQLMFHQLTGSHTLEGWGDTELDWGYAYSQAKRFEPDNRLSRYDFRDREDGFALSRLPEGNRRLWADLADNNHDASLDVKIPYGVWSGLDATLQTGANVVFKRRESDTRRFGYDVNTNEYDVLSAPRDELFVDENIGPGEPFTLSESTRETDAYTGLQDVLAGYLMTDLPMTSSLKSNFGARVEYSRQVVETFNPTKPDDIQDRADIEKVDVMPAVNLTYEFTEKMQVRAGASQTVNRPNFRELSSSISETVVGGDVVRGNPDLERAQIRHLDARWEWYPDRGQSLSFGAFYKSFESPIEYTYQAGAQPLLEPRNVEGANNYGVEVDFRSSLELIDEAVRDFYVSGNVALIQSRLTIG